MVAALTDGSRIISRVVHSLNGSGFTTGLELEVKVSDVEYESEEITR